MTNQKAYKENGVETRRVEPVHGLGHELKDGDTEGRFDYIHATIQDPPSWEAQLERVRQRRRILGMVDEDDIIADRYYYPVGFDENLNCTSYGVIKMLKPILGPPAPVKRPGFLRRLWYWLDFKWTMFGWWWLELIGEEEDY